MFWCSGVFMFVVQTNHLCRVDCARVKNIVEHVQEGCLTQQAQQTICCTLIAEGLHMDVVALGSQDLVPIRAACQG